MLLDDNDRSMTLTLRRRGDIIDRRCSVCLALALASANPILCLANSSRHAVFVPVSHHLMAQRRAGSTHTNSSCRRDLFKQVAALRLRASPTARRD